MEMETEDNRNKPLNIEYSMKRQFGELSSEIEVKSKSMDAHDGLFKMSVEKAMAEEALGQ